MCTVLLRFAPGTATPVVLAAVRDEYVERPWDPPARHWGDGLVGGRDRHAGGTWLAVDPARPAVAALLNGSRLELPADAVRPSRGSLVLDVLRGRTPDERLGYDGFHLLHGSVDAVELWTWDGESLAHREVVAGDHVIVNAGLDVESPVVRTGRSLLARLPTPTWNPLGTQGVWGPWASTLEAAPSDAEGQLLVRHEFGGKTYGSTSVSLVALSTDAVHYAFSAVPATSQTWSTILPTEGL